jgi:hypothetical protein
MKFYAQFKYKIPNSTSNATTEILRIEANDIQEAEYKIKDIVYKQNGYDLEIIELYII